MIPARYAATRFPAKLMQPLGDKTVIASTYLNTVKAGVFTDVYVVTDSSIIYDEILRYGGKVIMSKKEHNSGSDRIAEAIADMEADVVVNVQGDEPFVAKAVLQQLTQLFINNPDVKVASLMRPVETETEFYNPNCVKVVTDNQNNALYFSRAAIPHHAMLTGFKANLHIGIYGYKKEVLLQFTKWAPGLLENTEKLEQLRYLENGYPIKMALVNFKNVAIDTPEDLVHAQTLLENKF